MMEQNSSTSFVEQFVEILEALLVERGIKILSEEDAPFSEPPSGGHRAGAQERDSGESVEVFREALQELAFETQLLCGLYWRKKHEHRRPSFVAKPMKVMQAQLEKAADIAEELGPHGSLYLLAASREATGPDDLEAISVIVGLRRLARNAALGAAAAKKTADGPSPEDGAEGQVGLNGVVANSAKKQKGQKDRGPTADVPLRDLVSSLALSFSRYPGIRPSHRVDPGSGKSISLFDVFLRHAFMKFSPGDPSFPDAALREATRAVTAHLDDEFEEDAERIFGSPKPSKIRPRS